VVSQTKSRKIPTRNILPLFFASRHTCKVVVGRSGELCHLPKRSTESDCGAHTASERLSWREAADAARPIGSGGDAGGGVSTRRWVDAASILTRSRSLQGTATGGAGGAGTVAKGGVQRVAERGGMHEVCRYDHDQDHTLAGLDLAGYHADGSVCARQTKKNGARSLS